MISVPKTRERVEMDAVWFARECAFAGTGGSGPWRSKTTRWKAYLRSFEETLETELARTAWWVGQ